MSEVERLEAAIEKLEALKAESTPAPWHYWTNDLTGDVDLWHDQEVRSHIATVGQHEQPRVYSDAELIVTLHRTIDAQLAILRTQLESYSKFPPASEPGYVPKSPNAQNALALADSILGGES